MTRSEQRDYIQKVADEFPKTFGLQGFPGETFRIGIRESYFVDNSPTPSSTMYLYTQRLDAKGEWLDFAKGTPAELRRQVVPAPKAPAPKRSVKHGSGSVYEVVVGNVGTVLTTTDRAEAEGAYDEYVGLSESSSGRAAGESVVLMYEGEPIREHSGENLED